jgi:hypothetical protein
MVEGHSSGRSRSQREKQGGTEWVNLSCVSGHRVNDQVLCL